MEIVSVEIERLKLNQANPRTITDAKFQQLVKSIREFPEMLKIRPIVVDDTWTVLGGNMRLRACMSAGLTHVPVINAKDLTDEQKRRFIITDNVGFGEWDWEALAEHWDSADLEAWGLDIPDSVGFGTEPEVYDDGFEVPEEIETDIQPGDIIEIGPHKLLCADSTMGENWERLMEGTQADLCVTDPPYNVDYEGGTGMKILNDKMETSAFYQFLLNAFSAAVSHTKPGGAWYVWHSDSEGMNFRKAFIEAGLQLKQCLVWVKNMLVIGRQDYQWKHEPCLYGWKSGAAHFFVNDRTITTVIEDNLDIKKLKKDDLLELITKMLGDALPTTVLRHDKPNKSDLHPTMKPVTLIAELISNSSVQGQLVIDGFLGSGTTMVASHQLNRRCFGMELDPKYAQVIIDRMIRLDPAIGVKVNGKTYDYGEKGKAQDL